MIEAINGKGVGRAKVICDGCGRSEVVGCDYMPKRGGKRAPHEGQVIRRIGRQGWMTSNGKHECPTCGARRRAFAVSAEENTMAVGVQEKLGTDPALRQPSGMQKRLIILALEDAYDDQAGRYRDSYTDKSLADEIGDGVMFGWVAAIREEMFGPDGSNAEIDAISADLAAAMADLNQARGQIVAHMDAAIAAQQELCQTMIAEVARPYEALQKRLEAVRVAVGPRAGRS